MKKMNNWILNEDTISKKINNFTIKITVLKNDINVFYRLEVYKNNKRELTFNFYSLEDSINFSEETISNCIATKEILELYEEQFERSKFKPLVKSKR